MADSSPRVNAARLPQYVGRTVRLTCKTLKTTGASGNMMIVQASDGGEVQVDLMTRLEQPMQTAFVEVIGTVVDTMTIKMLGCVNLGDELDMKLVNDVVELWHDPRFAKMV